MHQYAKKHQITWGKVNNVTIQMILYKFKLQIDWYNCRHIVWVNEYKNNKASQRFHSHKKHSVSTQHCLFADLNQQKLWVKFIYLFYIFIVWRMFLCSNSETLRKREKKTILIFIGKVWPTQSLIHISLSFLLLFFKKQLVIKVLV